MIGGHLAHYRVTGRIGAGGMGEVRQATDSRLGRDVALKVLPPAVAEDAERMARFEREARVLASLNHPGIASIYGLQREGDLRFLVMELAEGEDLAKRLARGPLLLEDALQVARQVAEAVEDAHARGIVHRDLKPANIKVSPFAPERARPLIEDIPISDVQSYDIFPDGDRFLVVGRSVSPKAPESSGVRSSRRRDTAACSRPWTRISMS